ncbi:hypothetical protein CPB84DRAFT_1756437 [Gymnopilus junonius]|uniref:MULE transposase domain-containing protein n=1 Tax=Gymnopilus junonius TaxID=109634 RepID=A0A9P5N6P2_GYMJU|nr:hypothetical protein CPB84DRAFT_1756437 [Gymnopilus junonius]
MAAQINLPFGVNSVVPELQGVPGPRKTEPIKAAPSCLRLSKDTQEAMNRHVKLVGLDHHRFNYSVKDQQKALELFSVLQLYVPNPSEEEHERNVQCKFSIQKSDSNILGGKDKKTDPRYKRYTRIYQCGCMIAIDEISGILDHSELCNEQIEMDRNPRVPLSPELRNYALGLLRENTPLSLLRSKCASWAENKWPSISGDSHFRYRLTPHDASSLYRTISRERGIYQRTSAEDNLDKWFRAEKPQPPSPLLSESCLNYQPHEEPTSDRFEIILSTPEMREAAWKYGHKKQVLMDLTFGVCSARALLLILMAIDENGTGIPICFIMFTARDSVKATHADYNKNLLDRLLGLFKQKMGLNALGEEFDIRIGTTDNDTRERFGLTKNWPAIFLLLCIFHIWQAWRNALNKQLSSIPKGDGRQMVRRRIGKFLMQLLKDISDHDEAMALFRAEKVYWQQVKTQCDRLSKAQATAALKFLDYLNGYVEHEAYWKSWSPAGASEAARLLGVAVSTIARTTNHLESFNGRIKSSYYQPYQHSGRLPRIDVWILLLITAVMPDFFKDLRNKKSMRDYYAQMRIIRPCDNAGSVLPGSDTSSSSPPSFTTPVSVDSSSSSQTDATYHDDLIKKWLQELEDDSYDFGNSDTGEAAEESGLELDGNAEDVEEAATSFELSDDRQFDHDRTHPRKQEVQLQTRSRSSSMVDDSVGSFDGLFGIHFGRERDQNLNRPHPVLPRHPPSSPGDVVPDSMEYEDPNSNKENLRPTLPSHPDSPRSSCSSHENSKVLLYLPVSPKPLTEHDHQCNNEIVTAMMELQAGEDMILRSIRRITDLEPLTAKQLEKHISPSILARLNSRSEGDLLEPDPMYENNEMGPSEVRSGKAKLVPFEHTKKERRKESYRIRHRQAGGLGGCNPLKAPQERAPQAKGAARQKALQAKAGAWGMQSPKGVWGVPSRCGRRRQHLF